MTGHFFAGPVSKDQTQMTQGKAGRTHRATRLIRHMPTVVHISELVVGLVVLAAAQNFWAVLVGANPDITPPSVPAGIALAGRSATEIDLSWTASTDDTAVVGYHVYRNGSLVGDSTTASYSDTGLTPNTGYTYAVSAYDAVPNTSANSSDYVASTLADTTAPSVPGNLHQTGQTTGSITIAWNPSTDNVAVTTYDVYRNGTLVRSQPGTTYTDTGLAVYTGYTYNIAARDAANNGSNLSNTLFAGTAPDTTAPTVPDNLHKVSSTVSSITLNWDASTDDIGVAGYKIYRDGSLIATQGGTTYTDTGLSVSSSYTYTIAAYDASSNQSAQSAPYLTTSSNDTTAPTIPAGVHTTTVQDTSLTISWTASTDDVAVTGYKIYRDGSLIGTTTSTSFNDSGLSPVTQYDYTVKAYDAANNVSAASAVLHATTAYDTTAPTIPANLQTTSATDTTISLQWDAATDNVGVTGYDLYRNGVLITSTVGTSFTDTGLHVNTSYSYKIRSHDGSGNNSSQSTALNTGTIADVIAPAAPTGLASAAQTTTSIDLTWNTTTDDASAPSALTYSLFRNGVLVTTQSGTSFTDTNLHYNTTYHYTVTATDESSNSSTASADVPVATLPDTVAPSVSLTAPGNGQSVQLTFPISATASDDLDLDRVEFYADGALIATIRNAPFSFNWNSYAVHNGARILSAKAYDASGNYASQSVTVNVVNPPPPITGDLNGDHKVNIYDLSILLSHFNKSGGAGSGDFNNNGKIDIFDLSTLLSRFGSDNSNYQ